MGTLKRGIRFAFAVTLSLLASVGVGLPDAGASLITFNFEGSVTSVGSALTGTFNTTQTISGSYTFDSATLDVNPDPKLGEYPGALTALTFTLDGYTGTLGAGTNSIVVANLDPPDAYDVFAPFSGASVGSLDPDSFFIVLGDGTGSAFNNDSLPTTPPDLFDFSDHDFLLTFDHLCDTPQNCQVLGTITSWTLAPVPEPSTLALLGIGLVGVAAGALRRRRR